MSGSTFGKIFKITTWGESHGDSVGVVIDGCPAGLELNAQDIQKELNKRKPNNSKYSTKRNEQDKPIILSGIFDGTTIGTPICVMVKNNNAISKDYSNIKDVYRPSHADFTYDKKYEVRDYRGGGRASGRETIGRVIAGAVAKKILSHMNIDFITYTKSIGNIDVGENIDFTEISKNSLKMPNLEKATLAEKNIQKAMSNGDSLGGTIRCIVKGAKAGIGEPVFDKLDANIAKAVMSIPSVKAVEIGNGKQSSLLRGSENNDGYYYENETIKKYSNNGGGIYGGISDGSDIVVTATIKPTPSISKTQNTINKQNENVEIQIKGRHDSTIVPRAIIVVESMIAITLVDLIMEGMGSRIEELYK